LLDYEDADLIPLYQDADAHAMLIPTSGAAGNPKLVTHTQGTLLHTVELALAFAWNCNVGSLCHAPLYQPSGSLAVVVCLTLGAPCILPDSREFEPGPVLDAIERHHCTRLSGTPLDISKLIRTQRERPRRVDSLASCMVFGDIATPALYADFQRVFHTPLRNVVAMAEAIGCLYPGLDHQSVPVVPGLGRLVDEHGRVTPEGEVGELVVRGENVFKGYWKGPDVVDNPRRDDWYYTGEMMRQVDGDEFRYEIRKSDVIIRAGECLSPLEIARVLLSDRAVADAAVTGLPDPCWASASWASSNSSIRCRPAISAISRATRHSSWPITRCPRYSSSSNGFRATRWAS
jgi:long-chain acyl-CoA synthetase